MCICEDGRRVLPLPNPLDGLALDRIVLQNGRVVQSS